MYYLFIIILLIVVKCDKKFSMDSEDTTDSSTFGGMVVLVQSSDNDEPEIVISNNLDGYKNVFCLKLEEMFEANTYVTTYGDEKYGDHDEENDSEVDFQGDVTWTYTRGAEGKSFILNGIMSDPNAENSAHFDSMEFVFTVATAADDTMSYGLEYSFQLNGYEWVSTDVNAKLVLVFEVKQCGDDFESNDFSEDEAGDDHGDHTHRRLKDTTTLQPGDNQSEDNGANNDESEDGISSDDSDELDIGILRFINNPIAHCIENGTVSDIVIGTNLIYGDALSSDEMHIVFDHFDCDLFQ
eukprot:756820_1